MHQLAVGKFGRLKCYYLRRKDGFLPMDCKLLLGSRPMVSCLLTNNSADYAFFVCFVRPVRPRFLRLRKVRRQSRPCIYYANTVSTFQPLLEGDVVFKLNPGPDKSYQIPSR